MSEGKFPYNVLRQFEGENFATWKFRMECVLRDFECLGAIQEENFSETASNQKLESKAKNLIVSGMADSHLSYISEEKTAYSMWKKLKNQFENKGVRSKIFLRRKLLEIKYTENISMAEHFNKITSICNQLKDAGSVVTEEEHINFILMSMPKSYEVIVTALETMSNLSLDTIKDRLLGEEEKRKEEFSGAMSSQRRANEKTAFLCFNCGKPGHKRFECYAQKGTARGAFNNRGAYNSRVTTSNYQPSRGARQPSRGNYQRGQNKYTGQQRQGFYVENNEERSYEENISAFGASYREESEAYNCDSVDYVTWCVDSGCSDHLTNRRDLFVDYLELSRPKEIAAAKTGVSLKAVGVGNIKLRRSYDRHPGSSDEVYMPRKRPFCNAFTGCGRKRSATPGMPLPELIRQRMLTDEDATPDEESNQELTRQLLSEARMLEAMQDSNSDLFRKKINYPLYY